MCSSLVSIILKDRDVIEQGSYIKSFLRTPCTHLYSYTMRYTRLVLKLLVLFIISSVKSEISKDEKVVLVSPVLAPYRNARAQTNETAKDFPLLMLLAGDNKDAEPTGGKIMENSAIPQPVYVKKLEDQRQLLRRRRKTSKIYFVQKY